jgi:Protein of unknown function (DUF3551)
MRILPFMLAIFVLTVGIGAPAKAQNYPWCAIYDVGDAAYNCGFISREQCMATVRGIGGFCNANTQYVSPAVHPVPRAHKHS